MKPSALTYQFKITLREITPAIWRRIVVRADSSFWDLHVAIQDSMGWLDYHLHLFHVTAPNTKRIDLIGVPDDDAMDGDEPHLPGWTISLANYFQEPGDRALYEYDFGDGWEHDILLESVALRTRGLRLPICLDGERACPPEDCGGVPGYENLLKILVDPDHDEHDTTVQWLGRVYKPDEFDPKMIRFENPKKRFEIAFEGDIL